MPLFFNYKERGAFFALLLIIFSTVVFTNYQKFLEIKKQDVYFTGAVVEKQYKKFKKNEYWVLKLKAEDGFTFYTTSREDLKDLSKREITVGFLTKRLEFLDLFQGFYATSIYISLERKEKLLKEDVREFIYAQHEDRDLEEFFGAIFLGEGVGKDLREKITNLGIAHLIALSGFHLGVIITVISILFLPLYSYFHKRYFPYRNKYRDLFTLTLLTTSSYLYFVGFIPSLIRAYTMALFGYFLASRNFKIVSFENLFWVGTALVALFPKLLFSIGFFFSMAGVFYIFLFVRFVEVKNKFVYALLLSLYLFFVMSPIVYYFFPNASYYQLLSPFLTMAFTLLFPLEIFLHIFNFGGVLDPILRFFLDLKVEFFQVQVKSSIFWGYLLLSLIAPFNNKIFYGTTAFATLFVIYQLF